MLFEVYLTLFGVLALIAGGIWLLIRRPVKRRWERESRWEAEQKREAELELEQRKAAQREVESWTREAPERAEQPAAEEMQENRRQ